MLGGREPPENNRADGRRVLEGLTCTLGRVVDMSRGGMRVASTKLHEGELDTCLMTMEDEDVEVRIKVCWTKKVGFRKYELGCQFIDVDDELAKKLLDISTVHQYSKVLKY